MIWFEYFEDNQELFSAFFSSKKTNLFRKRLLQFIMKELSGKIRSQNGEKDVIYTRFFAVAILGILEAMMLKQLPTDMKTAAI
ncbi:MAG: TetR family transcriptional regulator C-terminal domain-containing protein [Synergistaceae bacterium]|nr:TetR family transcriptional regulator C-terminal domain-containing protein [Synergistaceae bacterium]